MSPRSLPADPAIHTHCFCYCEVAKQEQKILQNTMIYIQRGKILSCPYPYFLSNLNFLKKETNNKTLKIVAFCLPCVSQLPEAFRTWKPAQTALQTRSPLTGGHLSTGPFFLPFCKLCASLLRWVALPFYGLALHPKKLPCRRFATDDCFCRNRFLYRTWACSLDIRYGFLTKIKNTSPPFFFFFCHHCHFSVACLVHPPCRGTSALPKTLVLPKADKRGGWALLMPCSQHCYSSSRLWLWRMC